MLFLHGYINIQKRLNKKSRLEIEYDRTLLIWFIFIEYDMHLSTVELLC